ncbi:MAG: peptidyl-prolyl cis-trans isomerase [Gemmatimonadetes bacterium]|nr:peptidyl-prolyl cis-trans isomerase [Gemmatimonadota bacterium]
MTSTVRDGSHTGKRFMNRIPFLVGIVWLQVMSCGHPDRDVVAEVGRYRIEAGALRSLVADLLPGQRPDAAGDEARRHYLQVMVDGRLMLLEAENRALESLEEVQAEIREAVDKQVRRLYLAAEIPSGPPVTEADARARFEQEGFGRERLCSAVLVAGRATMDSVLAALSGGRSFEEVASQYSLDSRSAAQGGELGYVGPRTIDRLNLPPDLFRSLPAGKVSPPVPAGRGAWQIFRFTDERGVPFARHRVFIETLLQTERRTRAERQHLERLQESFEARLNAAGLQELIEAYGRRQTEDLPVSTTALYLHDEGAIGVAEANETLRAGNLRRAFADSADAAAAFNGAVLRPYLIRRAAREAGYYDRPDIAEYRERVRINVLAGRLRALAMEEIELSEADIRAYYDANPGMFRIEPYTSVEELLLPSAAEAAGCKQELLDGEPFENLVSRSMRSDAVENEGQYHFHPRDALVYPLLMAAIDEASAGEWTGPVQVEEGFSVFRVSERIPEGVKPYERARNRARQLLLREKEAKELDRLVNSLREKYEAEVVVHEGNLRGALPDSLLAG